ncbi:hypothetical protein HPP92_021992 [Vanilla planifolia]|uniref:Pectinesterase inhibitor domain-containing protein n=1 Tax=Vanilla planifolia TaxID=51239 RepID=A0A835PWH8_VANPL|nr:hypothetical protein HPP92_021992 [Vanilla planifolia]
MDVTKDPLILLFFFSFPILCFSTKSPSHPNPSNIEWWCRQVPHPESCRYYLSYSNKPPHLKQRSEFYQLSVKAALRQAIHAENHVKRLGPLCQKKPEKTAWLDCWKLFGNTVVQINRTMAPAGGKCTTGLKAQSWLSAALTNLFTCGRGFSELKVNSNFMEPIMRYNVSNLISNCLAINKLTLNSTSNTSATIPTWSSLASRKLLQLSAPADFVVARDGSGKFRTIKAALDAAAALRRRTTRRIVIHVKTGVYTENLQIVSSLNDLTIKGDGKGKTIISGSRSVAAGFTTFSSPTVSVFGDAFIATGITIRNTFGPGSQAVALLSGSDQSVFYRCSIEGYQDTLCVYTQRQFYMECDIYGTIDFIFGNAAVVIQNSSIFARTPKKGESNVITAQGRTDKNQNTGIVIQFSKILAAPEFWPVHRMVKSYLGRPWQKYSRTIYLQNFVDSIIDPAGWLPFNGGFALDTNWAEENHIVPSPAANASANHPHVIAFPDSSTTPPMGLVFLFFSTLVLFALTPAASPEPCSPTDIDKWCVGTPFPKLCSDYMTHSNLSAPPKDQRDFYKLLVQIALGRAIGAQNYLESLGGLCRNEPERTAWLDCRKLYGNTVVQLNRSLVLSTSGRPTAFDAQTWLSAALTNIQTCRMGFTDLTASCDIIHPIMRYEVSKLISNCLAVNKYALNANAFTNDFPKRTLSLLTQKRANIVVAKDGSGRFRTIRAAVNAATRRRLKGIKHRIVIYVKAGVYTETINVKSSLYDLTLTGDGIGVFGDGFIASGITFRNTFGPGSQAVALLSGSDRSIFYRCSIEGYQDTLCVYSQRQFYRECDIYGTIDFIFGNAAVVIQKSNIILRNPRLGECNVITAQGRTNRNQNTGIVIQFCSIRAAPDLRAAERKVQSYLGRPWQLYARTVYLENYIEGVIDPTGWLPFVGRFGLDTLFYAEFKNSGPGSKLSMRVKWRGFHVIERASLVQPFTVRNFITGGVWIPPTGVPFALGL